MHYRYCAQIKTVIRSSSEPGRVLKPRLLFAATAHCAVRGAARKAARAKLQIFAFSKSRAAVGKLLHEVELEGGCSADGRYHGKAALSSAKLGEEWVVVRPALLRSWAHCQARLASAILHVKPSARAHTAAPHCGSHCASLRPPAPRIFNTPVSVAAGQARQHGRRGAGA